MKELEKEIKQLLKVLDDINEIRNNFVKAHVNNAMNQLLGSDKGDFSDLEISDTFKNKIASNSDDNLYQLLKQYQNILNITINLNKLLDKPIKKVSDIESVKYKEILTVKDVELLYSFSKTSQTQYRQRLRNAMPYKKASTNSKSSNTKIFYKKSEIDRWIDNFY